MQATTYNNYPNIYNQQTMFDALSSKQLFSQSVNAFIGQQIEKLPKGASFEQSPAPKGMYSHSNPSFVVYESPRNYSSHTTIINNNSPAVYTENGLKAQHHRNNQETALVIAGIVTAVGAYLSAMYTQKLSGIKEDIQDLKDFKGTLENNVKGHDHLDALHKVVNLRIRKLKKDRSNIQAKLAITIVAVASAIFLGFGALAGSSTLMAIGAGATALSLLSGIFTWTYIAYDRAPGKIADAVRQQLDYLKNETIPIPLHGRVTPITSYYGNNEYDEQYGRTAAK